MEAEGAPREEVETEHSITEWDFENSEANEGEWVLVKFTITKPPSKFYAGLVTEANHVIVALKFLRKKGHAFGL